MGSLKILKPGLLTTLQNLGNRGVAFYAIPAGGAMDQTSARQGNLIIGNEEMTSIIECTLLPPQIRFLSFGRIALTGANAAWRVNDQPVPLFSTIELEEGDILKGQPIRKGVRSYIAIQAELGSQQITSSGGIIQNETNFPYQGQTFKKGDVLSWEDHNTDLFFTELKLRSTIPEKSTIKIPMYPGPEFNLLSATSQDMLFKEKFSISPHSNRMGLRLNGVELKCEPERLKHSVPVFPGLLQLPPGGQPILLMRDAQTTGGYPRVGYVKEEELDRLSQIGAEEKLQFVKGET